MAFGKETLALLNGLADLVREVPVTALASLCQGLEALSAYASVEECLGTAQVVGSPKSRELVTSFLNAWCKKSPNVSPMSLSWAIRAAGHIDDNYRKSQSCELV